MFPFPLRGLWPVLLLLDNCLARRHALDLAVVGETSARAVEPGRREAIEGRLGCSRLLQSRPDGRHDVGLTVVSTMSALAVALGKGKAFEGEVGLHHRERGGEDQRVAGGMCWQEGMKAGIFIEIRDFSQFRIFLSNSPSNPSS